MKIKCAKRCFIKHHGDPEPCCEECGHQDECRNACEKNPETCGKAIFVKAKEEARDEKMDKT